MPAPAVEGLEGEARGKLGASEGGISASAASKAEQPPQKKNPQTCMYESVPFVLILVSSFLLVGCSAFCFVSN